MIERNNSEASLNRVVVNAVGGYLDLKSEHIESLIKAVDLAKGQGWTSVVFAEFTEDVVSLRLLKGEGCHLDTSSLRSALRRGDLSAVLACNSSTEVAYSEGEYVPEVINDIPPPTLIEEELVEEIKPKAKSKKKAVDSEEVKE